MVYAPSTEPQASETTTTEKTPAQSSETVTTTVPVDPEKPTETVPPVEGAVYGDVNKDGIVDIMDVIVLNKFLLGSSTLDDQARTNADVDLSGEVDSTDSLNILKKVVELIDTLPIQ